MTQIVEVEVIEVRTSGVIVKILEDGRTGFIRRRELSWERRVAFRPDLPEVGKRFEAKMILEGGDGRSPQLSLCQLTDPWKDAKSKYAINNVICGEVVNIRDFGVYVQIEPGIDAVIWPRYLPLRIDQLPQDVLSVGDQVQGVIMNVNWSKRKIELSITHRLEQVSQSISDGETPQVALFREKLHKWQSTLVGSPVSSQDANQTLSRRYHPPLPRLRRVLVIDDLPGERQRIMQALKQEREIAFETESPNGDDATKKRPLYFDEVSNSEEALEKVAKEPDYDLIIVDLTLKDEDGVDTVRKLLERRTGLSILFTSNDPLVDEKRLVIRGRKYPFALKEQEELVAKIDDLFGGYWDDIGRTSDTAIGGGDSFIRQLGMIAVSRRPLTDILSELLFRLRKETGVTYTMVLELYGAKESVAIVAADPLLDNELLYGIDALYYSPVQDVIENNVVDYRQYISSERPQSLKNFFPLLDYQTFLGIPLAIPGMPAHHALFLLDEYQPSMSDNAKEQAYLTAQIIQMAIERNHLLDFMHRYEQRYTLGELLGSLVHELTNKLDTLAAADTLTTILQRAEKAPRADEKLQWIQRGQETVAHLARAKQDLQELILSYSRLASGHFEPVDINETILKITHQMTKKANESRAWLKPIPYPDLPPARAVQPRLEQVITNVLLNAIQQIDHKRRQMAEIAHEQGRTPFCQQGVIRIQTRYRKSTAYPIEIIVMDSGPGISAYRQEEIFSLGTSGRKEGHGLGLYISRGLMETMGGRLNLVDSVTFLGSVFVIALSEFPAERAR